MAKSYADRQRARPTNTPPGREAETRAARERKRLRRARRRTLPADTRTHTTVDGVKIPATKLQRPRVMGRSEWRERQVENKLARQQQPHRVARRQRQARGDR